MNNKTPRREFLAGSIAFASALAVRPEGAFAAGEMQRKPGVKLRLALNAYSFNRPLMNGSMTLSDVVDYCSANNIDGLDATGYYFPGYPNVPADDYIYALKRSAYLDGVTISGAGVRNDFTLTDATSRRAGLDAPCGSGISLTDKRREKSRRGTLRAYATRLTNEFPATGE